jgi:hypothetical protein
MIFAIRAESLREKRVLKEPCDVPFPLSPTNKCEVSQKYDANLINSPTFSVGPPTRTNAIDQREHAQIPLWAKRFPGGLIPQVTVG